MSSFEEEDDDLVALRSAALASLNSKPTIKPDVDDLDALRQAALKSRNQNAKSEEDCIFEKLQPPKSSNLINLTPEPNAVNDHPSPTVRTKFRSSSSESSERSDDESESGSDRSSIPSSRTSSYEDASEESDSDTEDDRSSQDDEDNQENKNKESAERSAELKPKDEDEDILNAIDQFLDEGLEEPVAKKKEEITQPKPVANKKRLKRAKSTKTNKSARKLSENDISEKTETVKPAANILPVEETDVAQTAVDSSNPVDKMRARPKAATRRAETKERLRKRKAKDEEKQTRQSNGRNRRGNDMDSVHSSDLSFLGDSSDEDVNTNRTNRRNGATHAASKIKDDDDRAGSADKSRRENGLQAKTSRKKIAPAEGDDAETRRRESTESDTRGKPSDLRKKLEHRGLYRKSTGRSKPGADNDNFDSSGMDKNNNSAAKRVGVRRSSKIYVKPSLIAQAKRPARTENERTSVEAKKTENIVITRKISDQGFAKKSVRLKPKRGAVPNDARPDPTPVNRKRSVLHFAPDTSVAEKQAKIENLMKKTPSIQKEQALAEKEERTFSDISDQDFDDFEIAADFDAELVAEINAEQESEVDDVTPNSDTRKFITVSRINKRRRSSDQLPKREARIEKTVVDRSTVRSRLGFPTRRDGKNRRDPKRHRADWRDDARMRLREARQLSPPSVARLSRRRENSSGPNDDRSDLDDPRGFSGSVVISKVALPASRRSDAVEHRVSPDADSFVKRRRKIGITVKSRRERSPPTSRNLKGRLGGAARPERKRHAHVESPERGRKGRRNGEGRVPGDSREKEVDARIQRIHEQNEAILRRRKEVELEEMRYRLG